MRKMFVMTAMAITLATLVGCGQATPAASTAPRNNYQKAPVGGTGGMAPTNGAYPGAGNPQMTGQGGMPGAAGGPAVQEGERLKAGAMQAFNNATGFEGQVRSYGEGHYKSGSYEENSRTSMSTLKLTWMKPNKLAGQIIETSNPMLKDGRLATTDGVNITARAAGLLSLFPMKLQATDTKLKNIRNHPFAEQVPSGLMARIMTPTAVWTAVGQSVVEGVPTTLVQIDNVRRLDKEVTRETISIDAKTFQVRQVTSYAGNKRVLEYTFLTFRWNPKVTSSTFSL